MTERIRQRAVLGGRQAGILYRNHARQGVLFLNMIMHFIVFRICPAGGQGFNPARHFRDKATNRQDGPRDAPNWRDRLHVAGSYLQSQFTIKRRLLA
jgi:hypothetical protein